MFRPIAFSLGCALLAIFGGSSLASARVFAPSSPWNQPLSAHPRLAPDSAAIVAFTWTQGDGVVQTPRLDDHDYGFPVFVGHARDPRVRVHCREPWGRCGIEGRSVRIPALARPAAPTDAHLTIVNGRTAFEMYEVPPGPYRSGTLTIGYGDVLPSIDTNSGWPGPGVTAAGASSLGGRVTLSEFRAGRIAHALALATACGTAGSVYPARASAQQLCRGRAAPDAAPLGSRLWLDLSPAQIARVPVSPESRIVLTALHQYGGFVTDTNGESATLDLRNVPESPTSNPAAEALRGRIDFHALPPTFWTAHLHVIAPCVSLRRC